MRIHVAVRVTDGKSLKSVAAEIHFAIFFLCFRCQNFDIQNVRIEWERFDSTIHFLVKNTSLISKNTFIFAYLYILNTSIFIAYFNLTLFWSKGHLKLIEEWFCYLSSLLEFNLSEILYFLISI